MCDSIGIIEQSKLIVSGTVAEIKTKLRPHIDVLVQLTDGGEQLSHWLTGKAQSSQHPSLRACGAFSIRLHGPATEAELLRAIISANFSVLEYSTESRSLEDVFL
ncbi:MAG: DUF4162 domain-containing protein [Pirellulaceae bacterium]